jgi:hypothetical protein
MITVGGVLVTRRVTAHRGPKGHRHGGPQKIAMHTRAERGKARSAKLSRRNGSGRGDQSFTIKESTAFSR